jgi:hypothetical protein
MVSIRHCLSHPELRTGVNDAAARLHLLRARAWALAHRIFIPPGSHEEMNLDSPARGWKFRYAFVAAYQRTCAEYRRAEEALLQVGGNRRYKR